MSNFDWLFNTPIAHRGLHNDTVPENSLEAFRAARDKGYNIELDVHLLMDGEFAVFHDANLLRVCGVKQKTDKLTAAELKNYKLKNTEETIPNLKEVFDLIDGKVGILIEIKTVSNLSIARKLYGYIQKSGYTGKYAIQCFTSISLKWFRRNTKDIPIGILSFNYKKVGLFGILGYRLSCGAMRNKVKPDFIAFRLDHLPYRGILKLRDKGLKLLTWTVDAPEKLIKARTYSDNVIFEKEEIFLKQIKD